MGRKTAPQPLALGSTDAPVEDPPTGETYPQSSPPISGSSPTSPRSPRSPFGFAQKKTQQGPGERKPLHVADLLQQPQHPLDASHYLPISSALHQPQSPPLERTSGQLPQQQQQHHRPQEPVEEHQQVQQPYIQEQQFQPPSFPSQQLAQRHHRNNEEKASKSGFFFNFAKSSKSSDRLITDQYSDSRSDIMPRDNDQSSISRQNARQTGKSF